MDFILLTMGSRDPLKGINLCGLITTFMQALWIIQVQIMRHNNMHAHMIMSAYTLSVAPESLCTIQNSET